MSDLLDCMPARIIVATKEWLENNLSRYNKSESEVIEVSDEELRKVSFLQHPQQVLAVFPKIENIVIDTNLPLAERIYNFLKKVNNPYILKVGNIIVEMEFSDNSNVNPIQCIDNALISDCNSKKMFKV